MFKIESQNQNTLQEPAYFGGRDKTKGLGLGTKSRYSSFNAVEFRGGIKTETEDTIATPPELPNAAELGIDNEPLCESPACNSPSGASGLNTRPCGLAIEVLSVADTGRERLKCDSANAIPVAVSRICRSESGVINDALAAQGSAQVRAIIKLITRGFISSIQSVAGGGVP